MIVKLNKRQTDRKRLLDAYENFEKLLVEINKKEVPDALIEEFNQSILRINQFQDSDSKLSKLILTEYRAILKTLEKELNVVAKNHYQNIWMAIGMSAFGLPIGVVIFAFTQDAAFIAIGLPIGLPIGLAIGSEKDKKAKKEGRQVNVDQL